MHNDQRGVAPPPEVRKCASGLRIQALTGGPVAKTVVRNRAGLPVMCPISGNPRAGSDLTLTYRPVGWVLEVYSIVQLLRRFRGGWPGTAEYPAERNMEGAIQLIAQMSADALGVPVRARASLVLDAGAMDVVVQAHPRSTSELR